MIDRQSYVPLYIQLKKEIKQQIKAGIYKVGDMIPSEKELIDLYDVGRATVREAIGQLVTEGYLDKRQGIGTFVKAPKKAVGFEPLISLTYALNQSGFDLVTKVSAQELVELSEREKDLTKIMGNEALYLKRCRYVDEHPVVLEDFYFHRSFHETIGDMDLSRSIGQLLVEEMDIEIIRLNQEVTLEKPDFDIRKSLKLDVDDQVLKMKRWTYIKGLTSPYQYYELVVPAELSGYVGHLSNSI